LTHIAQVGADGNEENEKEKMMLERNKV